MRRQTIFSLILAPLLLVPWLLKSWSSALEPYPAVILPSGAWTVSLKTDEISFPKTSLYGRREGGEEWIAVDARRFLDPIPVWYLHGLVSNEFGLQPTRRRPAVVEADVTKEWLRERLQRLGFRTDAFKVAREIVKVDRQKKEVIRTESRYEKIYVLN